MFKGKLMKVILCYLIRLLYDTLESMLLFAFIKMVCFYRSFSIVNVYSNYTEGQTHGRKVFVYTSNICFSLKTMVLCSYDKHYARETIKCF